MFKIINHQKCKLCTIIENKNQKTIFTLKSWFEAFRNPLNSRQLMNLSTFNSFLQCIPENRWDQPLEYGRTNVRHGDGRSIIYYRKLNIAKLNSWSFDSDSGEAAIFISIENFETQNCILWSENYCIILCNWKWNELWNVMAS